MPPSIAVLPPKIVKPKTDNRWFLPGVVGVGVTSACLVLLLFAVRLTPVPSPSRAIPGPALTLAPSKQSDHLLDLEPLFLPTEYNASTVRLPPQEGREPGRMAASFPPKLPISESLGGIVFPEPFPVPNQLLDVLQWGEPPSAWAEVGRRDVAVPALKPRLAFIEVTSAKTGQPIFSLDVPSSADVKVPSLDWAPLEFLVAVDSSGLVGAPVITGSTTTEEVESFFRTFVAKTFHLGARLTPGFYTVRIGP